MSSLKNFLISFLVSALIFGILAYFFVGFLNNTVDGILNGEEKRLENLITDNSNVDDPNNNSENYAEVQGDSFSVLFAVTDKREEKYSYFPTSDDGIKDIQSTEKIKNYTTVKVKSIVLACVSKETREYSVISIPSKMKVGVKEGGNTALLEDVLSLYDKEYFMQKVHAVTGVSPDYYVFANITEIDNVINALGNFDVDVPKDIYSNGKQYVTSNITSDETTESTEETTSTTKKPSKNTVSIEETVTEETVAFSKQVGAGKVTVGSANAEAILLFENYKDNCAEQGELLAGVVKGIIGNLSYMDNDALGRVYSALYGWAIDTNMTYDELMSKGDLIRAYRDFNTTTETYPGSYSIEKGAFMPDITGATKEYKKYRFKNS